MEEEAVDVASINHGTRKKKRQQQRSKQQVQNDKYKDKDPLCTNFFVPCVHKASSLFKCQKLKEQDIVRNRKLFYENKGKVSQDIYLCRLIASFN